MATDYVVPHSSERVSWSRNVGDLERKITLGLGVGLIAAGILARGRARRTLAGTGTSLALRAAAGWCPVYATAGIDRRTRETRDALAGSRGLHVRDSVLIRAGADRVYRHWRDLARLPRLMPHLESVVETGGRQSHWVARGPLGLRVEWDAEIVNDVPNQILAWRSLEGADLVSAGSVQFRETPIGTEVRIHLQYAPPAGAAGAALAWFFGETPGQELHEGLVRLRDELEEQERAAGVPPQDPTRSDAMLH